MSVSNPIHAHGVEAAGKLVLLAGMRRSPSIGWRTLQVSFAAMILLHVAVAQVGAQVQQTKFAAGEMDTVGLHAGALTLYLGDRLKIAFFEKIDGSDRDPGSATAPLSNIVERVELTGEYTVQQDGSLFLPLLGPTPAAGRTIEQVQERMATAFKSTFGREGRVSLVIVEREPVYVVGPVGRPGSYKHTPGMTILHAIAMSGGFEGSSADVAQYLETVRENERLQRTAERLKTLLARSAILKGERLRKAPETPSLLVDLAGAPEADKLITETARMRKLAENSRQAQLAILDTVARSAKSELESLHARAEHIKSNISARTERLGQLRTMRDHGSSSGFAMLQARSDLSDVQERLQDVMGAISRTEQRLAQSQHERLKILADAEIERDRDLFALESEIAQERLTLATSRHLLGAITKKTYNLPGAKPNVSFQVVRRTAAGPKDFSVGETFVLEPGDLVRVSSKVENGPLH